MIIDRFTPEFYGAYGLDSSDGGHDVRQLLRRQTDLAHKLHRIQV